jgi:hypothetical protein
MKQAARTCGDAVPRRFPWVVVSVQQIGQTHRIDAEGMAAVRRGTRRLVPDSMFSIGQPK